MLLCPSTKELERFLRGEPSSEIGPHLRTCASCQTAVERLSDEESLKGWAGSLASRSLTSECDEWLSRLVSSLCILEPAMSGWSRDRANPAESAMVSLEPPDSPGDLGRLGDFAVEAELGRGGMGIVYRARDRTTGRVVALKVLHVSMANDRNRRRFVQEVRAVSRVEHDNVIRLYSTYDPPGSAPYFVMEYVAGPTLADEVRKRKRLEPAQPPS